MKLKCTGSPQVFDAIASAGRTEDVSWSPNGQRIALAAIALDRILIVAVEHRTDDGVKAVHLTGATEVASASLQRPHGICWIGNDIIAVANREGSLVLFDLPAMADGAAVCHLVPRSTIGREQTPLLSTPGSVCARALGTGLHELWVCNGFAHHVTHHLLDAMDGFSHLDAQMLMHEGLEVPDGVAIDPAGDWVAVSNHDRHAVAMYRNDEHLVASRGAAALLQGVKYPHGLHFAAGGRLLLVADAGAPHVVVFVRTGQQWVDQLQPHSFFRVLDDAAFKQGHHNPREGGPKGIDVHEPWGIMVTSCAEQPLAFFDIDDLLRLGADQVIANEEAQRQPAAEPTRVPVLRLVRNASAREALVTGAIAQENRLMRASWSWRLTAPLRLLGASWGRWRWRPPKF